MDATADWTPVHPKGLAAGILGVSIAFTILSTLVLGLRLWTKLVYDAHGTEDLLMYVGGVINLAHNAAVIYGSFTGIGTPDADIPNTVTMIEGAKMVTIWQLFYVTGSAFIKTSICATLVRVAIQRRYIYALYVINSVIVSMTAMAFIVVFIRCRPMQASWTGDGQCITTDVIVIPTYIFSGVNIVTDWCVAIMPAFILRKLQLPRRLKVVSVGVLGLGVLASIATIIRMPYIGAYTATTDQLEKVGNIILWTVVETNLGIIAGSLPMLRKLFKSLSTSANNSPVGAPDTELVTIGRISHKKNKTPRLYTGLDEHSDDQHDGESTRHIIRTTSINQTVS